MNNLRIRVWAAGIRDGGGPQATVAGLVCDLLDILPGLVAVNVRQQTEANLAVLVGRLVLNGAGAPPA